MQPKDQMLEVWGELACFSRPELKVERFSYPLITPSAARGIFDAVYCKPREFRWQITKVEMLTAPSYIALRRNEVKEKAPAERTVRQWMRDPTKVQPILANADSGERGRTQRQTMALKNVHYLLHAHVHPWPGSEDQVTAFEAQFRRRAAKGKCFYQPYFGCREFPAYFQLVEAGASPKEPLSYDAEIGVMLYDVFDLSQPGTSESPAYVTLFDATVRGGVLEVPDFFSDAVLKPERRDDQC